MQVLCLYKSDQRWVGEKFNLEKILHSSPIIRGIYLSYPYITQDVVTDKIFNLAEFSVN